MTDHVDVDPVFDPRSILEVLHRHEVEYVAIGAFAALAQGAPIPPTADIDVTPSTTKENLERLSSALTELQARIRTEGVEGGLPFAHDGASLSRATVWNLVCRHGQFDLAFQPSGTGGYEDLMRRALVVDFAGQQTTVADLADIIRSKEAAARLKDFETLPILEQFRREKS